MGRSNVATSRAKELGTKHNTVRVKAWAVEEEVFDGFRYSPAPGAIWVSGQTQAKQIG